MSRVVRGLVGLALLAPLVGAAPAGAEERPRYPAGTTQPAQQRVSAALPARDAGGLTVTGRGYGHGIGMSQYGAEGAARKGLSYRAILRHYYRGTRFRQRHGFVRVRINADRTNPVVVLAAPRLKVRDRRDGRTFRLPDRDAIRRWRIVPARGNPARDAVQYRTRSGWHRWALPGRRLLRGDGAFRRRGPLRLVLPGGKTRRYRGALRAASPSRTSRVRDTVNVVRIQSYLKGVLAKEMPASWSQPALRAQAVAARSYALYLKRRSGHGHFDLCDTTRCQVYAGFDAERASTNAAVRATNGVTINAGGAPVLAMFSSSSGGWTANGGEPYLRAHRDRYDRWQGNPMRRWNVRVRARQVRRAYPGIGRFERARVTRRNGHGAWGGRVERVVLVGSRGRARVSGEEFRLAFGLPSAWFHL